MKIELQEITIRDVVNGYTDSAEKGVTGYDDQLDIRPAYQREFIYGERERNAVISTILSGFPLNVMYWIDNGDAGYEVMDGQQRTISFCQYVSGNFSVMIDGHPMAFHNLTPAVQDQILDYTLMVYFCTGTEKEKLDWFRIINIAGMKLTDQELLNTVYSGPWLTHAKTKFSKTLCPAWRISSKAIPGSSARQDYLTGSPIRQDYLETAISWRSAGDIEPYMSAHQHDPNANELWSYFQAVITWVNETFPVYRREMKGMDWGALYDEFGDGLYDTDVLETEIRRLMADEDVSRKKGIYPYVLTRDEKYLSIRAFSPAQKREAYELQGGICSRCGKHFEITEMEADHITPWSQGGKTEAVNCQMLCRTDNRSKGAS